jgi:hypothetical protein
MGNCVWLDKKWGQAGSLQPFFGAGSADPCDWAKRLDGQRTDGTKLGDDQMDLGAAGSSVVLSAGYTGIAGYTKYQVQLSVLEL